MDLWDIPNTYSRTHSTVGNAEASVCACSGGRKSTKEGICEREVVSVGWHI